MTPIIVDVEASGFGKGSYPIEIGLVLPDGTPHCFLLAPARTWTAWDPGAEKVHRPDQIYSKTRYCYRDQNCNQHIDRHGQSPCKLKPYEAPARKRTD